MRSLPGQCDTWEPRQEVGTPKVFVMKMFDTHGVVSRITVSQLLFWQFVFITLNILHATSPNFSSEMLLCLVKSTLHPWCLVITSSWCTSIHHSEKPKIFISLFSYIFLVVWARYLCWSRVLIGSQPVASHLIGWANIAKCNGGTAEKLCDSSLTQLYSLVAAARRVRRLEDVLKMCN